MKRSDWIYISNLMWVHADQNEKSNQRISGLLRELVIIVNEKIFTEEVMEVKINEIKQHNKTRQKWINRNEGEGIDDNDENGEIIRSDGTIDTDSTSNLDFK